MQVQVRSKQSVLETAKLASEVSHLRTALRTSENLLGERDSRIADLHAELHSLDARRGDLQIAVASTSSHAGRLQSRAQDAEARLHALQRQLREADEANEALRQQVSELRVRCIRNYLLT
jgi:chromosome segregation ATPase